MFEEKLDYIFFSLHRSYNKRRDTVFGHFVYRKSALWENNTNQSIAQGATRPKSQMHRTFKSDNNRASVRRFALIWWMIPSGLEFEPPIFYVCMKNMVSFER
jgi:hypothetical protein